MLSRDFHLNASMLDALPPSRVGMVASLPIGASAPLAQSAPWSSSASFNAGNSAVPPTVASRAMPDRFGLLGEALALGPPASGDFTPNATMPWLSMSMANPPISSSALVSTFGYTVQLWLRITRAAAGDIFGVLTNPMSSDDFVPRCRSLCDVCLLTSGCSQAVSWTCAKLSAQFCDERGRCRAVQLVESGAFIIPNCVILIDRLSLV